MKRTSLVIVLILLCCISVYAQPVLTPRNVALGGGGSTYITDYNANFYNPANLLVQDRRRNVDFGLLITGTYFNAVQNFSDLNSQRVNLEDYIYAFNPGSYDINPLEREQILTDNYIKDRSSSLHQTRLDLTLLGFKWRRNDRAYSIVVRNRISSSFEVGKGWYSSAPQERNNLPVLNRTLKHRYQSLYEFSFGYAESFKFFTDMTPRLDQFIIGIAPKLVLGGAYQDASWKNVYEQSANGSVSRIQNFEYTASGNFGAATKEYLGGVPAETALTSNISDEIFDYYGIGAGLDIGFTYLLTLGNDLSTISENRQSTSKSLRISFSITDIGFVSYDENAIKLTLDNDTTASSFPTGVVDEAFVGAPGQFLDFTDQYGVTNPFATSLREDGTQSVLLPTAIHGGVLLEVNRLKLMGDLSIGLTNNAFNSTKLIASAGVELRPLKFLPLRAGAQLATELPSFLSFGTAIETSVWDLSIATQFVSRTFDSNPTLTGVTVAALQFHF